MTTQACLHTLASLDGSVLLPSSIWQAHDDDRAGRPLHTSPADGAQPYQREHCGLERAHTPRGNHKVVYLRRVWDYVTTSGYDNIYTILSYGRYQQVA